MDDPFGFNREIEDEKTRRILTAIMQLCESEDIAACIMLVNEDEVAWSYHLPASWNAFYPEPEADLKVRIRASTDIPEDVEKVRNSGFILSAMINHGNALAHIGESFIKILKRAGVTIHFKRHKFPKLYGKSG